MYFFSKGQPKNDDTYVVAIGASAGGLEAINELFDNIFHGEHIAYVIVQHLSSDYKSLLVELVGKHTQMPVEEARHGQKVEAGKVYVIPNNKSLTIHNGLLKLSDKEFDRGPNTAIDNFLQSLAQDQRNYAIAVLLSGTGTDGTKGIEAIKRYDGFVITQDPQTAKFDGMPKSAIASGYVDVIAPPYDVYHQIGNHIDGVLPSKIVPSKKYNDCIHRILATVYRKTGYDFIQYKQPTILRRIARRMQLLKIEGIEDYEYYVKTEDGEPALLAKEFFIGVTNFFRDKDAFAKLYKDVIIKLVESKSVGETLKVWITACSTGQEAYTIAILLDKAVQELNKVLDIKIFASDIDKSAIEAAAKGKYQRNQLLSLEPHVVQEYFTEMEDGFCVIPRIRKQIVFAAHDVLRDPPFIKNDLVTCRNLLIYINPPMQERVISTLHFALNPGGFLFIGTSENPSLVRRGFTEVDNKWKIFQRTSEQGVISRHISSTERSQSAKVPPNTDPKVKINVQLSEDFTRILANHLGYAGVYINEQYEVKEAVGNFRKYLSLPDRVSSLHLLKMTPPDLSAILSTSLRKSLKENKNQVVKNVKVRIADETKLVNIYIYPPSETSNGAYSLVVFADLGIELEKATIAVQDVSQMQKEHYVLQLEEELRETRTSLQTAIESLETANEEMQSSNEELQSANEELQSSNEELQSLNEELHTLNTEHQMRIKELVELNDDITNYMQTSLIGQVFLDNKLRIRRFNKAASQVINIIESDIGRPIEHITHHLRLNTFLEDIEKVNKTGVVVEREIDLYTNSVYLIRILPYIRQDKMRDGIVITLVDITATKNLNNIIKGVFDASAHPIFVFEAEGSKDEQFNDFICTIANKAAYHTFGRKVQEDRLSLVNDFPELATTNLFRKYVDVVQTGKPVYIEINISRNGSQSWYQAGINRMQHGFVLILTEITQLKGAEEKLRRNYNELLIAKETLRTLNDQLEQKVIERTRDLEVSEERFRIVASLTNDVIWDWNFAANHIWWSDSYYDLFQFSKMDQEINNHTFRLQRIHPDDRIKVQSELNKVLHGTSKELSIAYRYQKNNGEYAHVLDRGTLLTDDQGIPYRMIGAMVDVTRLEKTSQELQKTNAELQSLVQQFGFVTDFMPQMVWATQPDGYHDFYNQKWYEYTGLDFVQSKDKGWASILHPDDYERSWEVWKHSLETGEAYEIEYRMRRHDGVYRWFLARALPMRDHQGNITKWFGTCTDIHDQKVAEQILEDKIEERTFELRLLNKKLEASNADLMQFASVASHDLKEPLRKIHIFSGLVNEQLPKETNGKTAIYMDRIIKASSRATSLINDVLSYSRLSSDNLFEQVDLDIIVDEILLDFELVIQEKRAKITKTKLPVIEAVPGQMRQLFQNIISNALKFQKPEHLPQISIQCASIDKNLYKEVKDSKGDVYEIRIKDNGIGFSNQYAKKIFSLFQRLKSKDEYEGTGIGLAIAYKIVERHHGHIDAIGKENEGAEFIIVLPALQQDKS